MNALQKRLDDIEAQAPKNLSLPLDSGHLEATRRNA